MLFPKILGYTCECTELSVKIYENFGRFLLLFLTDFQRKRLLNEFLYNQYHRLPVHIFNFKIHIQTAAGCTPFP